MRDTPFRSNSKLPKLAFKMPDMRCAKRLQTGVLHRLQQPDEPSAQRYRQGFDFSIDGRDGFDRPTHARYIAYPLFRVNSFKP